MERQKALARYDAMLAAANIAHASAVDPVGGYLGCSREVYLAVVEPARAVWDAKVAAAFAAYQQEVS